MTRAYVRMNHEKAKAKFYSNCHVVCVGKHNGEAKDLCSIPAKARAMPYAGLCVFRLFGEDLSGQVFKVCLSPITLLQFPIRSGHN